MAYQKIRAFTIVELLVVVTIIGILAAAVSVSVLSFRGRSRDSRRAADFSTIEKTLAAYYTDHFEYPGETDSLNNNIVCDSSYGADFNTGCPPDGNASSSPLGQWYKDSTLYSSLSPTYISTLPVDPLNDTFYYYRYEPSKNPARQCFLWEYWTESGGRTNVPNNIGDLKDASGVLQTTCNF
ncbi:MAG: general secretion pathway protein G [Berkelbacteria bacterium GW2011_GWA2_38_9]|uniref:General secretion pathway protein G n=1 Tax=Berkelbacteria bacterium GW2011_GWA2_38_9 TaxID=1618334 RepID=A0A0G0LGW9_9BACT|nr:MAG: general secretion pathway protein G [Berkelbacteria bacterium GW2011_GWA2_38_9]